jgi:hypothetical protein
VFAEIAITIENHQRFRWRHGYAFVHKSIEP